MTVTDQLKTIANKIKVNQDQYNLQRLAARMSAYSSGDLRKHKYMTGKDLGQNRVFLDKPNLIILHWVISLLRY